MTIAAPRSCYPSRPTRGPISDGLAEPRFEITTDIELGEQKVVCEVDHAIGPGFVGQTGIGDRYGSPQ